MAGPGILGDIASQPKPIGVPAGYKAVRAPTADESTLAAVRGLSVAPVAPNRPFTTDYGKLTKGGMQVPPRYKDGDQYLPSNLETDDLIALQNDLIAAGLLDPDDFVYGVKGDEATLAAFEQLLAEANRSGATWQEALTRRKQQIEIYGNPLIKAAQKKALRAEQPPLTIQLDNPEDIRAILQDATKKLYGGQLSPDQEALFTTLVQGAQEQFQRAAYSQQYNTVDYSRDPESESNYYGPGGVLTAPATGAGLANQAEEFVKNAHPEQVFTSLVGQSLGQLIPSLGLPAGGLAR